MKGDNTNLYPEINSNFQTPNVLDVYKEFNFQLSFFNCQLCFAL